MCKYLLIAGVLLLVACSGRERAPEGSVSGASSRVASKSGCAPVFAALQKVSEQERVGQYLFANLEDSIEGVEPMVKRIADKSYVDIGMGQPPKAESRSDVELSVISTLEAAAKDGVMICESLGEAMARGERVQRYRFPNPMKEIAIQAGRADMTSTMTLWISESSGLPIYQETPLAMGGVTENVGTVFVYGDNVRDP